MKILDAIFVKSENISLEAFIKLSEQEKANIKNSRIIPPSIEDNEDFGCIQVEYQNPIFKAA